MFKPVPEHEATGTARGGAPTLGIAMAIDEEVKKLVTNAYENAINLLRDNRDKLNLLAKALLEFETLDREDIEALLETGEAPVALKKKQEARQSELRPSPRTKPESSRPQAGSKPSPPDLAPGQA